MCEAPAVTKIRKRDGRVEEFQPQKIANAISKAFAATGTPDEEVVQKLAQRVVEVVSSLWAGRIPRVEDVQDVVEQVLMEADYPDVAKAYILYRKERAEARDIKRFVGVVDDLKLGVNAVIVLKRRYLLRDEQGNVTETPSQLFRRVARAVAMADANYSASEQEVRRTQDQFYRIMADREFLPNSPTLMNAGTEIGQLSACFVLPVEDSMESIFETLKHMALIHKSGGGTGFSFSRLRPKGDLVRTTMGEASGPVSFMKIYDEATSIIKQGGRRRGANMGILRVDHPDILEFVTAKSKRGVLDNFNISVGVTNEFMRAVTDGKDYQLINPRNGEAVKTLPAREVFDLIVTSAWHTGDPGLAFLDKINEANPTPRIGTIESTNPCGEVPLLPYESCTLGSIDLARVVNSEIDWEKLSGLTRLGVHFLDNVIDVTRFPLPQIKTATQGNRKIGLGVMGLADMLIELGIPYDSDEALSTGERVMSFIAQEAQRMSQELAEKCGPFPNFSGSVWDKPGQRTMRNAAVTSVAPTGTISIIAGTSSGIEPLFAVAFVREVMEGGSLVEVNRQFEKTAKERQFHSRQLMLEIAKRGSVQSIEAVPADVRRLFVTAMDIAPEWHVRMQAAFQRHVDNAVSKTVNLPPEATPGDVRDVYMMAYELGCKGITVYRYGSRAEQVLYVGPVLARELGEEDFVAAESEYAGGCPTGACPF
ncbi:MAG TPA: vitamin B12-dependent ribonucleotide reductase [Armatimonadota bacterium]|nr:vitamin B12-dependent ribonucleotide reductase [Armatimonadota bacterium]